MHIACVAGSGGPLGLFKNMLGPKYDGKYLRFIVRELLGDTKVSQALRNVVIPTFDIKLLQPAIFSRYDVRASTNKHISVSIQSLLHVCLVPTRLLLFTRRRP